MNDNSKKSKTPIILGQKIPNTNVFIANRSGSTNNFFFYDTNENKKVCSHRFEKTPEIQEYKGGAWHPCSQCLQLGKEMRRIPTEKPEAIQPCVKKKAKVEVEVEVKDVEKKEEETMDLILMVDKIANSLESKNKKLLQTSKPNIFNLESLVKAALELGWSLDHIKDSFQDAIEGKDMLGSKIVYEDENSSEEFIAGTIRSETGVCMQDFKSLSGESIQNQWVDLISCSPINRVDAQVLIDAFLNETSEEEKAKIAPLVASERPSLTNDISYRPPNYSLTHESAKSKKIVTSFGKDFDSSLLPEWTILASENQFNHEDFETYKDDMKLGKVFFVSHAGPIPCLQYSGEDDTITTPLGLVKASLIEGARRSCTPTKIAVNIAEINTKFLHSFASTENVDEKAHQLLTKSLSGTPNLFCLNSCGIPYLARLTGWSECIRHAPMWPFPSPIEDEWQPYFATCDINSVGYVQPLGSLKSGSEITFDFNSSSSYPFCGPKFKVFDMLGASIDLLNLIFMLDRNVYDETNPAIDILKKHIIIISEDHWTALMKQDQVPLTFTPFDGVICGDKISELKMSYVLDFYKNANMTTRNVRGSYLIKFEQLALVVNVIVAEKNLYAKVNSMIEKCISVSAEVEENDVIECESDQDQKQNIKKIVDNVSVSEWYKKENLKNKRLVFETYNSFMIKHGIQPEKFNPIAPADIKDIEFMISKQVKKLKELVPPGIDLKIFSDLISEYNINKKNEVKKVKESHTLSGYVSTSLTQIQKRWNNLYSSKFQSHKADLDAPKEPFKLILWTKRQIADAVYEFCSSGTKQGLKDVFGPDRNKNYATLNSLIGCCVSEEKNKTLERLLRDFVSNYYSIRDEEDDDFVLQESNGLSSARDELIDRIIDPIFCGGQGEMPDEFMDMLERMDMVCVDEYTKAIEKVCGKDEMKKTRSKFVNDNPEKVPQIIEDFLRRAKDNISYALSIIKEYPKIIKLAGDVSDWIVSVWDDQDVQQKRYVLSLFIALESFVLRLKGRIGSIDAMLHFNSLDKKISQVDISKISNPNDHEQLIFILVGFCNRYISNGEDENASLPFLFAKIFNWLDEKEKKEGMSALVDIIDELDTSIDGIPNRIKVFTKSQDQLVNEKLEKVGFDTDKINRIYKSFVLERAKQLNNF